MPPYDFFQQIQYIPVYLSPPPDNWADFHFYIKTFMPGVVAAIFTGTIAILAYRVSRTQRTIAANKYALDLFDKRYEIFDSLIETRDKITKLEMPDYDSNTLSKAEENMTPGRDFASKFCKVIDYMNNFTLEEFKGISFKLEKSARIFHKITKNDVEKFKEVLHEFEYQKNAFLQELSGDLEHGRETIREYINDTYNAGSIHNFRIRLNNHNKEINRLEADYINGRINIENRDKYINSSNEGLNEYKKIRIINHGKLCEYDKKICNLILKMIYINENFIKILNTMDEYLYISEKAY